MTSTASFKDLSDSSLIAEVKRLAADEHRTTAALIASLAEVDARRLYLGEGCASLFAYCTRVLHLSEHAAYTRIEAARTVRRFPIVLQRLEDGDLTLTAVTLLRPHLADENCAELLDKARHATKRDVEHLVASIAPRRDARVMVRRLPQAVETTAVTPATAPLVLPNADAAAAPSSGETQSRQSADATAPVVPPRPQAAKVQPLAPERYRVQFTVSRATHDKLRRAQDLLRHAVPNGDPAEIFDRALTLLLIQLERKKLAQATAPRPLSKAKRKGRHIPASVRRRVWARDGGRCAFEGREGRCGETGFLEFHHVVPFARGGEATVENLQLRCRAHNSYEAVQEFGDRALFVKEARPDMMDSFWTESREPHLESLGGQLKTGNLWTAQNRQFRSPAETL
jgi:hypothetical protein